MTTSNRARKITAIMIALLTMGSLLFATSLATAEPNQPVPPSQRSNPPAPEPAETSAAEQVEVTGRVVDDKTGAPIKGASVHASRTQVFATTGADGRFTLAGVPADSALVVAGKEGYAFASTTLGKSIMLRLRPDTKPARGEYPRPDADRRPFTGGAWLTLDGTWSFDFDPEDVGESERWFAPEHQLSKAIRVPFGYHALAAWGEEQLATDEIFRSAFSTYRGTVWYRRSFTVPADFTDERVRLRIGAADWGAAVWLDGKPVLPYSGDGYTEISADLGALKPGSKHTLAIRVVAPPTTPESPYPMGKQTGVPRGADTGWFTTSAGSGSRSGSSRTPKRG